MRPDIPEPPAQTYICSFCNGKQSSQDNLFQHLTQHVNFGGVSPSKLDLEKGMIFSKNPFANRYSQEKTQ